MRRLLAKFGEGLLLAGYVLCVVVAWVAGVAIFLALLATTAVVMLKFVGWLLMVLPGGFR